MVPPFLSSEDKKSPCCALRHQRLLSYKLICDSIFCFKKSNKRTNKANELIGSDYSMAVTREAERWGRLKRVKRAKQMVLEEGWTSDGEHTCNMQIELHTLNVYNVLTNVPNKFNSILKSSSAVPPKGKESCSVGKLFFIW